VNLTSGDFKHECSRIFTVQYALILHTHTHTHTHTHSDHFKFNRSTNFWKQCIWTGYAHANV